MLSKTSPRIWLWIVLGLALAIRLGHLWAVHDAPFVGQLAMDSQEYDRWAREIAGGEWLGETAFYQAPLYPYLLAALYASTGGGLMAVYWLQILVSVFGVYALYRAGRELEGETLGLVAAGLASLSGVLVFHDVMLLKTSLAISVTAVLLWGVVRARSQPSPLTYLAVGLTAGVLVQLRENALVMLLFLLPTLWKRGVGRRQGLALVGALGLGFALIFGPVMLRNAWVSGDPLPTTYQGGVNFWIGNHPGSDGTYEPLVAGKENPLQERREAVRIAERDSGRTLSSAEVSSFWLGKSLAWIRAEPAEFAQLAFRKAMLFWSFYEWPDTVDYYHFRTLSPALRLAVVEFGSVVLLALASLFWVRRSLGQWAPILLFIVGWKASIITFYIFSRYRLPAFPALVLLAAVPISQLLSSRSRPLDRRVVAGTLAILAALSLPHLLGYGPRWELVEYNLGRVAEEAGQTDVAVEHYRRTLQLDPNQTLALLNLGSHAARHRRFGEAAKLFERAVAVSPDSDDAWSNLGGTMLALGNPAAAATALDRALEINGWNLGALHNRALAAWSLGDLEGCRDYNRRLLELAPENSPALRLRDRLDLAGDQESPPAPTSP